MTIITFTSDFGYRDHYVAAVKAQVLLANPSQIIVDITHGVNKFDLPHAAHVVASSYKDFPPGTIHIIAVNSMDYPGDKSIAVKLDEHYFICSDNGLLNMISEKRPSTIVAIADNNTSMGSSFPAKELYAPAANFLAAGGNILELGSELTEIARMISFIPKIRPNDITGHVVHVDDYGNLITNINMEMFEHCRKDRNYKIRFPAYSIDAISMGYANVSDGNLGAVFNSNKLLEIFISKGNAAELLGLGFNSTVNIEFDTKNQL